MCVCMSPGVANWELQRDNTTQLHAVRRLVFCSSPCFPVDHALQEVSPAKCPLHVQGSPQECEVLGHPLLAWLVWSVELDVRD